MADNDRGQEEGGGAGNLEAGEEPAHGNIVINNDNNNNHRRTARGRAPSPVWLRDEVGGRMERVERTPFNVVMRLLDDPFPENNNYNSGGGAGDANEDDDHDSVESDDENNVVALSEPKDPGLAGVFLEDHMDTYRRYRLRDLTVTFDEEELLEPSELADDFRRFVRALDDYGRIRTIHLTQGNFGRDDPEMGGAGVAAQEGDDRDGNDEFGPDLTPIVGEACLEELFGTVLCKHYSLYSITFSNMRIPTRYWKLFTEGFGTIYEGVLVHLELQSTPFTMEGCQLLKQMCQRQARISLLSLERCGLGAEEWRTVCEGVAESGGETNYVTLWEDDATVGTDTLLPLLRPPPAAVEFLSVRAAHWAEGAFEGFVRGLRTTETTLYVRLQDYPDFPSLRLVEAQPARPVAVQAGRCHPFRALPFVAPVGVAARP
jgi:hypothetical protein